MNSYPIKIARMIYGVLRTLVLRITHGIRRKIHQIKQFYVRHLVRGPVIFRDRFGLRYWLYPDDDLLQIYQANTVFDDSSLFMWMSRTIAPRDVIVDVGAYVGVFTLLAARLASQGHVFAFEPDSVSFERLMDNIELSRLLNVTPVRCIVTDRCGQEVLNVFSENRVLNSLGRPVIHTLNRVYKPDEVQIVDAVTLDSFASSLRLHSIDLLKIDVEGAEPKVLAGCEQLFQEGRVKRLVFEISQQPLAAMGYSAEHVFDIVESKGFRIFRIQTNGEAVPCSRALDTQRELANYVAILARE